MSRVSILALIAAVIPGAIRLPMARANWLTSSGSTVAGRRTGFVTGSRSGFGGHAAPVYSALHMLHATSNYAILVGGQMGPLPALAWEPIAINSRNEGSQFVSMTWRTTCTGPRRRTTGSPVPPPAAPAPLRGCLMPRPGITWMRLVKCSFWYAVIRNKVILPYCRHR